MNMILRNQLNKKTIVVKSFFLIMLLFLGVANAQLKTNESEVGLGWSNNSVNTVVFRNSALTTFKDVQYTAYYNPEGKMVLARRKLKTNKWEKVITPYSGNVKD